MELVREDFPVEGLPTIRSRVDRAAKRAAKLGLDAPVLTVGEVTIKTWRDPDWGRTVHAEVATITLTAPERLGLAGWSLLGRVDRLPDGTPLIARTPGTESVALPEVTDANLCQHCGKHRQRSETFLVAHEDGRILQVGRQCLADFLGRDPAGLLWWFALADDISRYQPGEGGGERLDDTDEVLRLASRVAAHGGFLSISKVREIMAQREEGDERPAPLSTAEHITMLWDRQWEAIHGGKNRDWAQAEVERWHERYPDDEAAQRLYEATKAALAEDIGPEAGEWRTKVAAICAQPTLRRRHLTTAVSAVLLGLRVINPDRPERPKAEEITSQHMGEVGGKIAVEAEVVFARQFDGDWGARTLIKYRADGADLAWWATGSWEPEIGSRVRLCGTVKAHDIDRYTKRPVTLLTRAHMEEV